MPHSRVARALFDLYLDVEGTRYRCAQTTMNWSLNKIPMASCTLAVGREAQTLEVAGAHKTLFTANTGREMLKEAQIILVPKGEWKPLDQKWTEAGAQTIFRGYVTGVGLRMMRGSMRPTIQLLHWLSDLNFSSTLSEQSHPGNPGDLSWHAVYCGEDEQGIKRDPHMLAEMVSSMFFSPFRVAEDIWAECLHPMLWAITEYDQINTQWELGEPMRKNDQAQAALARIRGGDHGAEEGPDYVKMGLNFADAAGSQACEAIASWTRRQTMSGWWSTTMWSQMVNNLLQTFKLAIVPQVEHAMIVPYIAGTRPIWKHVYNTEYNFIDTMSIIPRPIQGVGIYTGLATESGEGGTQNYARWTIGGEFRSGTEKGMFMLKDAPGWLANVHAESAPKTIQGDPDGERKPTPNAQCSDPPGAKGDEQGKMPIQAAVESKGLFDRLAQAMYIDEVLRGRFGVLYGKLRFDIAPGSTILVEASQDPWIGNDALRTDLVASVGRVSCSLNAEGAKASTSYQLVGVRTVAENEDDVTSAEGHPLYGDPETGEARAFKGCPLLESYEFDRE